MKTLASLACVIPVVCMAQAPAPAITFEKTHHDFGKIPPDRKVSFRFKVTNTGTATLNITRLNPSCGCTSTVLGKWSLEPGESTEVEASFNPEGFKGQIRKSIQVVSDDPTRGTVTLTFEAEVVQDIMPSTNTVFFYELQKSKPQKSTIRLASGNGEPVKVRETKAPGAPYLSATVRSEGNDALVDLEMDARKVPQGKVRGVDTLTVITTHTKMSLIPIKVQWELKASVTANPEKIAWAEPAGKKLASAVTLKQAEGKPFKILKFKSSSSLVSIPDLPKNSAAQHEIQVVLSNAAKPGNYKENVVLYLDDPDQTELTLRVSAVLN